MVAALLQDVEGKKYFLLRLLVILGIGPWSEASLSTRDLHMTAFVNSENGNDVELYIYSEDSSAFTRHALNDHQLSTFCTQNPGCTSLPYQEIASPDGIITYIIILPLETGLSLVEFQYNNTHFTYTGNVKISTMDSQNTDYYNCNSTALVTSNKREFLVCYRENDFSLYDIPIVTIPLEADTVLTHIKTVQTNNISTLSNIVHLSFSGERYLCFAELNTIKYVEVRTYNFFGSSIPELIGCGSVLRLEAVNDSSPEVWARCSEGMTMSINLDTQKPATAVTTSAQYPYICPDHDVIMVVELKDFRILYGLRSTNELNQIDLPGNRFLPDSAVCFQVQDTSLLVFVDEEKGVYAFTLSTRDIRPVQLCDPQPCTAEQRVTLPLTLYNNRYVHVRRQGSSTLIDAQEDFREVISQHDAVDLAAVFEHQQTLIICPSSSVELSLTGTLTAKPTETVMDSTSMNDGDAVIIGVSAGAVLVLVTVGIIVIITCIISFKYCKRSEFEETETSFGASPGPDDSANATASPPRHSTPVGGERSCDQSAQQRTQPTQLQTREIPSGGNTESQNVPLATRSGPESPQPPTAENESELSSVTPSSVESIVELEQLQTRENPVGGNSEDQHVPVPMRIGPETTRAVTAGDNTSDNQVPLQTMVTGRGQLDDRTA